MLDLLNIEITGYFERGLVQIYDQLGKVVYFGELPEGTVKHQVQGDELTSGIFIIRLDLDGETLVQKFIVR